jgi:hypothetical protein
MNRKELEKLIDNEVSKIFSDMVSKEPESENKIDVSQKSDIQINRVANLTEEELDEILFFGGKRPLDEE